jgi:hypothetical protein
MSDTTVVEQICRQRAPGKAQVIGDRIIGVAEKECCDVATLGTSQPAAPPAPRRKRPLPENFRVRLDAVTRNPGEDCARLKIRIDLDTLSGLIQLCQRQGYQMESLIRRCLKRELGFESLLDRIAERQKADNDRA